jgi:hypothetical protein
VAWHGRGHHRATSPAADKVRSSRAFQLFFESQKRSIVLFYAIPDGKPVSTFPGIALDSISPVNQQKSAATPVISDKLRYNNRIILFGFEADWP